MSKLSLGVEKAATNVTVLGPMGRYIELDRAVDRAEGDGIRARWEFGHEVLTEKVGRKLPIGRLDEIAAAIGKSRAEVKYRALFARRYPDPELLVNVIDQYHSWFAIVNDALASASNIRSLDRAARLITAGGDDATSGDGWTIYPGEFQTANIPDASVDLILTDPPYPEEFADLWDDLATFAARVLVEGGILAALSGKIHVDDRMERLKAGGLQYGWVYCERLTGSNTRILARHTLQEWKPWVCYSRGPWPSGRIDWHGDVLESGSREKDAYHWQQAVGPARDLVERLTRPGDVVVDPFLGSGTYGVAALQAGRRFVGVEADAVRHASATERLRTVRP